MREQRLDGADAAVERGAHERRVSFPRAGIDVGACGDQALDDRAIAVQAGELERCDVEAVRRIGRGSGFEQQVDHLGVVELRGPMERRGSVAFGGVHVGAAVEQRVRSHDVVALDGVNEGSCSGRKWQAACEQYADADREWCTCHRAFPPAVAGLAHQYTLGLLTRPRT